MIEIAIVFKRLHKDSKGFTLIELIMAVTILGFVVLSLMKAYADVSVNSVSPEYRNVQATLAAELMEEIRSRRFDEDAVRDANGNWSAPLGIDGGETDGVLTTYDDVDDFSGFNEALAAPFDGFSRSVSVDYVASGDLNTAVAVPDPVPNDWTPDYKHVTVTVSHAAVPDLQLETVMTNARSDT